MFERFTDRARRVVVLAQEESRLLNHNYIGTEHILLGLVHEGDGVAAVALGSLGISLHDVRVQVEGIIGHGGSAPSGHIPFTPRAKKVLELSLREALQLGHNYIGTEHILLGLLREGEGVAAQVLMNLGADLSRVRRQVMQLLSGYSGRTTASGALQHGSGMFHTTVLSRDETARCSFCGRDLSEVASYAPGAGAAICNECIVAAKEALAAGPDEDQVLILRPRVVELTELLVGSDWLRDILWLVAGLELADCWVGAGAVRDFVWDTRFGDGFDPEGIADVDVVFFDPDDLTAEREHDIERVLHEQRPEVEWDVKNQARVHLWYEARFGQPAEPLTSTTDGISTWPETATAVGVRMRPDGSLDIAAPLGLDDLLDGIWRRNSGGDGKNRVSDAEYHARLERKQPVLRWPGVVVVA